MGKNKWTGKQNQCWSYLWCWTWSSSCWKIEDIHVVDGNNILFDLKPYLTSYEPHFCTYLLYEFDICRFSWKGIVFIELIFRDSCTNSYFTSFIINQFCNFTLCTMYCVSLVYVFIIIYHHWAFKKTKVLNGGKDQHLLVLQNVGKQGVNFGILHNNHLPLLVCLFLWIFQGA